jgi:hypothetical protein
MVVIDAQSDLRMASSGEAHHGWRKASERKEQLCGVGVA